MRYYLVWNIEPSDYPICDDSNRDIHKIDDINGVEYFYTSYDCAWIRARFCNESYHLKHPEMFVVKYVSEKEVNRLLMMKELAR